LAFILSKESLSANRKFPLHAYAHLKIGSSPRDGLNLLRLQPNEPLEIRTRIQKGGHRDFPLRFSTL
jgi:hypothetical protein